MKTITTFLLLWFALSGFSANAQNPPTIDHLDTVKIIEDDPLQSVKLTGMTDGDSGTQTLTLSAVSDRAGFFSSLEFDYSSNSDTSIVFQTAADSCGIANITVTVTDEEGLSTSMTFAVNVQCENDPPTIDQHDEVTVNEDPPGGVVQVELTGISAGPPNEDQGLIFTMYPVDQAMIDSMRMDYVTGESTGILNIYIAPDTSGVSTIEISLIDDLFLNKTTMSFPLTVNPVNDAPTLNPINDVTIENDEKEHTIELTGITEGAPNETDQILTFTVTTDNDALFDGGIIADYTEGDETGQLHFTPVAGISGIANVSVVLSDDGGTENRGEDHIEQNFTITITSNATGINEIKSNKLSLYPNPVADILNVALPEINDGTAFYEVYSYNGKKVSEGIMSGSEMRIPVNGLSPGLYQIKVSFGKTVYSGRFLVK